MSEYKYVVVRLTQQGLLAYKNGDETLEAKVVGYEANVPVPKETLAGAVVFFRNGKVEPVILKQDVIYVLEPRFIDGYIGTLFDDIN